LGQKVHPTGFRLGTIKTWDSRWYTKKEFASFTVEDKRIRDFLKLHLYHGGISKIEIERAADRVRIKIHTARPGIVIGRKGVEIERLKKQLENMINKETLIDILEVKRPELDAQLVAENIALQLTRRVAFRRAMKRAVSTALKFGAHGIKVRSAGRLGGAEMARIEWYREGRVPLHTLRADIDYGLAEAKTIYGVIGVKVWIFKGEVWRDKKEMLAI
jgi:small subunit ribosomal protein S3